MQCFTLSIEALPPVGSSEPPEFFGHRLQTSMSRATVVDSTAGPGQTLRTVGGLSFHGISGLSMNASARGLPGGVQAQGH